MVVLIAIIGFVVIGVLASIFMVVSFLENRREEKIRKNEIQKKHDIIDVSKEVEGAIKNMILYDEKVAKRLRDIFKNEGESND